MQDARIEQVRRQLQADILAPADAARRKSEEDAKGHAARIIEQGRATRPGAAADRRHLQQGRRRGPRRAADAKLVLLFHSLAGTIGELKIDRLDDPAQGTGTEGQPLAAHLVDASEQIKAATGIDVPRPPRDALGDLRPQKAPSLHRTT